MKNKELLTQLNNLKNIKPDYAWKERSREILASQISASGYAEDYSRSWLGRLEHKFTSAMPSFLLQPVTTVVLIVIVVLGGGFWGVNASRDAKPGDSLYIAKIISEKTQFALTFSEKSKVRLGISFASNRVRELSQVRLEEDSEEQVEKLKEDIKRELGQARERLARIQSDSADEGGAEKGDEEEPSPIFSATLNKEDQGMQVYEQESDQKPDEESAEAEPVEQEEPVDVEPAEGPTEATTTDEEPAEATTTAEADVEAEADISDPEQILTEAEEFLDNDDYDSTLEKLDEAGEAIENREGTVKGESEAATTT